MAKKRYDDELDAVQQEDLKRASRGIGYRGYEFAEYRYSFYRRKGYDRADAFRYAMAWSRNMSEQKQGRLAHGTGAVGWL